MKSIINISAGFLLLASCANIVAPSGGDKDVSAPELLGTTIKESARNQQHKVIEFEFNEYIQLNNWDQNFYVSPPLKNKPKKAIKGKKLILTIEDTLNQNTMYYIALNSCIKDNNEGNILDTLFYKFSLKENYDTLSVTGKLQDAYSLSPLENAWIMLFNKHINDTLIFKKTPSYVSKTNKNGFFHFPNLRETDYKIVALTGFDFIYHDEEKLAFDEATINSRVDSFISLYAFDPNVGVDVLIDSSQSKEDSIIDNSIGFTGKLEIVTNEQRAIIVQLLQNDKVIKENYFNQDPYLIEEINAGNYQLRYIIDSNQDSIWNTGNWEEKKQPEEVLIYPSEISIRSNWDLILDWIIEE